MELTNIIMIIMALYIIAQVIARFTPTKKDDEIVSIIGNILNTIFLKSNIKGMIHDSLESKILKEAVNNFTSKNKSLSYKVEREINIVAERIKTEAIDKNISIGKAARQIKPSSAVIKKMEKMIDNRFLDFKPKTKLGSKIKKIFGR